MRYFCTRMASILRTGVAARAKLEAGCHLQGRCRELMSRSEWMRRRGLKEMWSNRATTVKCFDALRVWALHERRRREVDDAEVEPTGAQVARWQMRDAFARWRTRLGFTQRIVTSHGSFAFGPLYRSSIWVSWRALVHLRHAVSVRAEAAEAAELRRVEAAARAKARAAKKAQALAAKQARQAAREAKRRERQAAREAKTHARCQRAFGGIVKRMVVAAERAEAGRETRRVLKRLRRLQRPRPEIPPFEP